MFLSSMKVDLQGTGLFIVAVSHIQMCMPGQPSHLIHWLIIPEAEFEMFLPVQYSEGFFVARLTHLVNPTIPLTTASSPLAFISNSHFSGHTLTLRWTFGVMTLLLSEKSWTYWRRSHSSMLSTEMDSEGIAWKMAVLELCFMRLDTQQLRSALPFPLEQEGPSGTFCLTILFQTRSISQGNLTSVMPARKDGKDMDVQGMLDWGEMWPIPSPAANSGCSSAIQYSWHLTQVLTGGV